ncbi:MAG: hypothetical protein F6K37_22140 [Moorea sp. SIO4E2]|uniref:hypothetical protein n=1 Tax=Moorena sp. SIO4E2 TaxID=2607826 RepID=UPI0013B7AC0A|nr:hypothetical protein [Moorena sp. SIO4E2]NEQ08547.1 hypothetical protein [Moorena sp. SIO4E2]
MATLREQPSTLAFGHATRTTFNFQPSILAFGHATRTTFNLGLWPRYANNLQPYSTLAFGHATRTTFNLIQPWPLATLREQPSTLFNLQQSLLLA